VLRLFKIHNRGGRGPRKRKKKKGGKEREKNARCPCIVWGLMARGGPERSCTPPTLAAWGKKGKKGEGGKAVSASDKSSPWTNAFLIEGGWEEGKGSFFTHCRLIFPTLGGGKREKKGKEETI